MPETLSQNIIKNTSYSFLGYIAPIVFSIFVTPFMVHRLGLQDYGVYVLINTIISFMFMADLGLGSAVVKHVAEYWGGQKTENIQRLMNSANTIFFGLGFVGLVVFVILGKFGLSLFNISKESQPHILVVFFIAGIMFALSCIGQLYISLFRSFSRFDVSVKISLAQMVLTNLLIIPLLFMGYKLKMILLVNLFATALATLYLCRLFFRQYKDFDFSFGWDFPEIKKNFKFGFIYFINSYFFTVLAIFDRLIIPFFLGPSSLAFYSLPGSVAEKISGITGTSAAVMFPTISNLQGQGENEMIRKVFHKSLRVIIVVAFGMAATIVAFADKIMFYWLGPGFGRESVIVLRILASTYFLISIYGILGSILLGLGRHKLLIKWTFGMALVNLILLFWWMPKFGIIGAAWAYFAGILPTLVLIVYAEKVLFGGSGIVKNFVLLFGKLLITAAIFIVAARFLIAPFITNLAMLILTGPAFGAVFFLIYKTLGFVEEDDWATLKIFISMLGKKLGVVQR